MPSVRIISLSPLPSRSEVDRRTSSLLSAPPLDVNGLFAEIYHAAVCTITAIEPWISVAIISICQLSSSNSIFEFLPLTSNTFTVTVCVSDSSPSEAVTSNV